MREIRQPYNVTTFGSIHRTNCFSVGIRSTGYCCMIVSCPWRVVFFTGPNHVGQTRRKIHFLWMNREYLSPVVCLIWGNLITGMLHEYFVNENFRLVVKKGEIDIEIYLTRIHLTRHCFFRCNRHDKVIHV